MSTPPHVVVLWLGLLIAALTDLRNGRIPNALTFPMIAMGVGTHILVGSEPLLGVIGCGAAFVLHFLLFALGIEKAGDAKLMMGVGACVGWAEMLETTAWWALLYLPIGLLVLAARGRLGNLVAAARWSARRAMGQDAGERPEATMLIAGPVIAAGGVLASLTDWLAVPISL